jgi:DNA-binding transcriptional LysR family regulator
LKSRYLLAMAHLDLNLLITLDVLLAEGSVARAAERLDLSPSAMSRALSRLRESTGDPLLVRAGRGMVVTPRALELRERVSRLVHETSEVLRPAAALDLSRLDRTFTLRTSDGFVESFGPNLIERVRSEAPLVRLRFVQKSGSGGGMLREGSVDLETGVLDETTGPEIRAQALFRDRFVGVVCSGHPLGRGRVTAKRFAAGRHIQVVRRGRDVSAVDATLAEIGLEREIVTIVDGFSAALALARASEMITVVPAHHTRNLRVGMHSFRLPIATPEIAISLLWHPRMDADAGHRWLRESVREVCLVK